MFSVLDTVCLAGVSTFLQRHLALEAQDGLKNRGGRQWPVWLSPSSEARGVRRIGDFYEDGKAIGSGSFGTVERRVHMQTGEQRAVKCINLMGAARAGHQSESVAQLIRVELQALMLFDHSNVVAFCEYFQDRHSVFFVTEFCDGGSLDEYLHQTCGEQNSQKRLGREQETRCFSRQLVSALSYIHSLGVCHRDVKPANVMLKGQGPRARVKLIDFGLAALCDADLRAAVDSIPVGTVEYAAPEIFLGGLSGCHCDVWSLGIVFARMVSSVHLGELLHPFFEDCGDTDEQRYHRLYCAYRDGEPWDREVFQGASRSAFELADAIFVGRAARPSAAELLCAEWLAADADSLAGPAS